MTRLSLIAPTTLAVVDVAAALVTLALIRRPRRRHGRWWTIVGAAALTGAVVAAAVTWYFGDVLDVLDVSPTWVDRLWIGALLATVAIALVNIVLAPVARTAVAVLAVAVMTLATGLAVNRDVGLYATAGQLLGTDTTEALVLPHPEHAGTASADPRLSATWHAPAFLPRHGRVGTVTIPATRSHFAARQALVYLPPAALVADAPALPVVILMSGQPGSPRDVIDAGRIPQTLDAFARHDHGLAPIVVVPDQLGSPTSNPMCVDGPLGDSATYLTVDVPDWIRTHLHVQTGRTAWAVGGFSQGATCALQFATGHPRLFGSFIDISGEIAPSVGDQQTTIDEGFGGSRAAYERATPAAIMRAHGRYADTVGFFGAGQDDTTYRARMVTMSTLAARHGITVTRWVADGSGHDWTTASRGLARGLASLYPRLGLSATIPVQSPAS